MTMTEFLDDPIQTLLARCVAPAIQIDLFDPGVPCTVISGQEVNDFVYSQHDLWDYTKGREAFRAAFGPTYLTLLSGQEYHTKQREIQKALRTDATDEQFIDRIKFHLFNRYGKKLSDWARGLAIDLIWTSLFPCTPVAQNRDILSNFENWFQAGIGLEGDGYYSSLPLCVPEVLGTSNPVEFADKSLPFIAGTRALSTMIEWIMIFQAQGLRAPYAHTVHHRPPFLLFPLYPSRDFVLDWKKFKAGELIFHTFVLPLLRGGNNDPNSIFGGGVHKCPGRHLVTRVLGLLVDVLEDAGEIALGCGGLVCAAYKFNGLLVPKYEHKFL